MKLVVTGAAGFLGQHIVLRALMRGHSVVAVVRPGRELAGLPWADTPGVEVAHLDLSTGRIGDSLTEILVERDVEDTVVIHAAGTLLGEDAKQSRETIEPTRKLLAAMRGSGCRRLILVSSLAVYGYAALPTHAQLDETTPIEPDPAQRDAYCRAKLAQEALAREAAQMHGLAVTVLRPGMIYGPERWWGARLGIAMGQLSIVLGGHATLPLCYVGHCAMAAVLAAEHHPKNGDVHVEPNEVGRYGAFESINIIDDVQPTQCEYLASLRRHVRGVPTLTLRLPWGLLRRAASLASLVAVTIAPQRQWLPGLLRTASLHARCKPLRYSNCRLHDRIGWRPELGWREIVAAAGKRNLNEGG